MWNNTLNNVEIPKRFLKKKIFFSKNRILGGTLKMSKIQYILLHKHHKTIK